MPNCSKCDFLLLPQTGLLPKLALTNSNLLEFIMILLSAVVVVCAVAFCFALAASSSPVYGFNANAELETRRETTDEGRSQETPAHQAARDEFPVVTAARMQ